jgi:hypothetical protein
MEILLKMKIKPDLTLADTVTAKADIYFDYNFPIETNDAITSFGVLGVNEFNETDQIVLYPNPTNDIVRIQSLIAIQKITVFDIQGREVELITSNEHITEVNMTSLISGIYFFSIETEKGTIIKKISKR